jgi:endonuclease G
MTMATVNYHVRRNGPQAFHFDIDGIVGSIISPELTPANVTVRDVRSKANSVNFSQDGIVFVKANTQVKDFEHGDSWKDLYKQELSGLLKHTIDLTGWSLSDNQDNAVAMGQVTLKPGESTVVKQLGKIRLANTGDVIKLHDDQKDRIDWVNYTEKMVKPGAPVLFLSPRDTLELDV